jgi:hypothetical protein
MGFARAIPQARQPRITTMTELVFQARPFVKMAAPTVRSICDSFLKAMDSFAAERLRNAVPVQARRTALGRARRGRNRTTSRKAV